MINGQLVEPPETPVETGEPIRERDLKDLRRGARLLLIKPLQRVFGGKIETVQTGEVFLVHSHPFMLVRDRQGREFQAPLEFLHFKIEKIETPKTQAA